MNPNCIACQTKIKLTLRWDTLFSFSIFQKELLLSLSHWLCSACLHEIHILEGERCALCSRTLHDLAENYVHDYKHTKICYDCLRWSQWEEQLGMGKILSGNKSTITYNFWAERVMNRYKFRGDERLKYFFASLLVEKGIGREGLQSIDMVSAIPLSKHRLAERGFNQSALIAGLLAHYYQLTYVEDLIIRLDDEGQKQSKKNRQERTTDLFQKFIKNSQASVDIYNKNILLVDDIYTTGATMYAAAYALKEAGARIVQSVTVAR